jgi:hypothetical protein
MADTLHFEAEPADSAALPYRLELWTGAGDRLEAILATVRSASLGYACYYGALREYAGRRIVLRLADKVIASSGAAQA